MCTTPATWVPVAQIIVALVVSSIAAFFAFLPYRIARDKLRLDLYNKRFEIYRAYISFVAEYTNEPKHPLSTKFHEVIDEAEFLMPDIATYLKEVRKRAFELWAVNRNLEAHGAHKKPDFHELVEKDRLLRTWLIEEITSDKGKAQFSKYLSFPETKILGIF